jgi:hypothetical protein
MPSTSATSACSGRSTKQSWEPHERQTCSGQCRHRFRRAARPCSVHRSECCAPPAITTGGRRPGPASSRRSRRGVRGSRPRRGRRADPPQGSRALPADQVRGDVVIGSSSEGRERLWTCPDQSAGQRSRRTARTAVNGARAGQTPGPVLGRQGRREPVGRGSDKSSTRPPTPRGRPPNATDDVVRCHRAGPVLLRYGCPRAEEERPAITVGATGVATGRPDTVHLGLRQGAGSAAGTA